MNPCPRCSHSRQHLESACSECGWQPESQQTDTLEQVPDKPPGNRQSTLWWAFLISAPVAPISFAIFVFVFGMIALSLNPDDTGTPIAVVAIPVVSLTVGVLIAYVVGAALAMPILLVLERKKGLGWLNIFTTLLACSTGCIWAICCIGFLSSDGMPIGGMMATAGGLSLVAAPFVLTSGIVFWWMQRKGYQGISLKNLLIAFTILGGLLALAAPILRSML